MKVFLIDKSGRNNDIANNLKKLGIENIEIREDCKMKATKNDYIVIFEDKETDISKTSNVILITTNKDKKFIWNFANNHNCIDIIDATQDRTYIAQRIQTAITS